MRFKRLIWFLAIFIHIGIFPCFGLETSTQVLRSLEESHEIAVPPSDRLSTLASSASSTSQALTPTYQPSGLNLPILRGAVLRGSLDTLNQNQRYRLRLLPEGWGEFSARQQSFKALNRLDSAQKVLDHLTVLKSKYQLILTHHYQLQRRTLLETLALLKSKQVKVAQVQLKFKKSKLSELIDAENRAFQAQLDYETLTDELDLTSTRLLALLRLDHSRGVLPTRSWNLPPPEAILKRIADSDRPEPSETPWPNNPEPTNPWPGDPRIKEQIANLDFLHAQIELTESEDRRWIDYVDLGVRVNALGQSAVIAEVALPVPFLKPNEKSNLPALLNKKREALRSEAKLDRARRTLKQEQKELIDRLHSLGTRLLKFQKSEEIKNAKSILKLSESRVPEDLDGHLKIQERILDYQMKQLEVEESFFKTYLELEERSGKMTQVPRVNLLSESLEPIES